MTDISIPFAWLKESYFCAWRTFVLILMWCCLWDRICSLQHLHLYCLCIPLLLNFCACCWRQPQLPVWEHSCGCRQPFPWADCAGSAAVRWNISCPFPDTECDLLSRAFPASAGLEPWVLHQCFLIKMADFWTSLAFHFYFFSRWAVLSELNKQGCFRGVWCVLSCAPRCQRSWQRVWIPAADWQLYNLVIGVSAYLPWQILIWFITFGAAVHCVTQHVQLEQFPSICRTSLTELLGLSEKYLFWWHQLLDIHAMF